MVCCVSAQFLEAAPSAIEEEKAETLYYHNETPNKHGDFHYAFQTSNGITTKAAGNTFGHSGVVQYISPEGTPITLTYVADSNGYHPSGDHLPKIPDYILRSLEYIQAHSTEAPTEIAHSDESHH